MVTIGGDNLSYFLGDPVNAFGKPMEIVVVRGGVADLFIEYD